MRREMPVLRTRHLHWLVKGIPSFVGAFLHRWASSYPYVLDSPVTKTASPVPRMAGEMRASTLCSNRSALYPPNGQE
jgi:hypothetical protein